jgi:hypothetical protein
MTMLFATPNSARTLGQRLAASRQLAQTRRQLSRLPERLLADIGLSPEPLAPDARFGLLAYDPRPAAGMPLTGRGPALPRGFAALARLAAAIFPNRA